MKSFFINEAIRLSEENLNSNLGGPFGAVIVKNEEIIGFGSNEVTSSNDPTAHAEIVAIRNACKNLNIFSLKGCEIYTSCEPCPMCLAAIYWARISKIYYTNTREDAAKIGFDDSYIYDQLSLNENQRDIQMEKINSEKAYEVFQRWGNKQDRTEY